MVHIYRKEASLRLELVQMKRRPHKWTLHVGNGYYKWNISGKETLWRLIGCLSCSHGKFPFGGNDVSNHQTPDKIAPEMRQKLKYLRKCVKNDKSCGNVSKMKIAAEMRQQLK